MHLLTADLGNSRAKFALWQDDAVVSRFEFGLDEGDGAATDLPRLKAWLAGHTPRNAALSSVAGTAATQAVVGALEAAGLDVLLAPPPGVENTCAHPETTGMDRLYAARAAARALEASCVVVDCGTALTVDAVELGPAGPRFLGGAIAAGPTLLARAVAAGGARLPAFEPQPGDPALGCDTEGALRAGVASGLRGAARGLVEDVVREAGLGAAPVALTGGARAFLLAPSPFTARALLVEPDLVHRGLLLALGEALDAHA